jgi:hypothetical protein
MDGVQRLHARVAEVWNLDLKLCSGMHQGRSDPDPKELVHVARKARETAPQGFPFSRPISRSDHRRCRRQSPLDDHCDGGRRCRRRRDRRRGSHRR